MPLSLLAKSFMVVPFTQWFLPTTWKTGAKFSGKWGRVAGVTDGGSLAWLMMARRRADAGKHHGATAICVSNSPVASRHSGLLVLARSTKNGLGSSSVGPFGWLAEWIVRATRRVDRSESSLGRLSGRLAESIVWVVCRADIRKARQVDCWGELPRGIAGSQGSFGRKRRQGASLRGSDSGCFRVIHDE